jgi:hypothetical protein
MIFNYENGKGYKSVTKFMNGKTISSIHIWSFQTPGVSQIIKYFQKT